jgi:ankyrin repeat protein
MQEKYTALHLACQNGHVQCVEMLLSNVATVDCTDREVSCFLMIWLLCVNNREVLL